MSNPEQRLLAIGIEPKTVANILKNKAVTDKFMEVLNHSKITECPKEKGALLYAVTTKIKPNQQVHLPSFVQMVVDNKWTRVQQIDEATKWFDEKIRTHGADFKVNQQELEAATGVGVTVTKEQIEAAFDKMFEDSKAEIDEQGHTFSFPTFITKMKDVHRWADGALVLATLNEKKQKRLADVAEPSAEQKKKKAKPVETKKEEAEQEPTIDIKQLIGRDVDAGNSAEILAKHRAATGGRIMTRFPPEPNGYLHIGHAKAIRFNFRVAQEYGGQTYLRFDDTNPCKENNEFIDHIREIVGWLGYKPWKETSASDYFQELYELAVKLIKKGLAYVCFQNKEEMAKGREQMIDSPYRNTTVEQNLALFDKMKKGYFAEGECSLRMKMDMKHVNPCMRDTVCYRIRYVPHPHSGDNWCIYPTYDYTHCICDSLENITHSLCTLEFEIRRESYYWLLKALDLYCPFVWEYSRLNISNTVLSKRKIEKLIETKLVTGWDDARLHTIQGLKRRGYTPSIINTFCEAIGVARKGNENITSYKKLEFYARQELDATAPRTFGVIDPVLLEIVNFVPGEPIKAPVFPADPSKGHQTYTLSKHVYIDLEDFSENVKDGFFGVMPGQVVCLRYGPFVQLEKVIKNGDKVEKVLVKIVTDHKEKVKGVIHWVSKEHSLTVRANIHSVLLTEENAIEAAAKKNCEFTDFFNQDSLKVKTNAKIWDLHKDVKPFDRFQFERVGYFCVDMDSKPGNIIINSIVNLKEAAEKKKTK